MTRPLHRSLARYLKRAGIDAERGPADSTTWTALLERLDATFHQHDQERYTWERSLRISSDEMRELHQGVERDRHRLMAILEAIPQAVVFVDPGLITLFGNQGAERTLGVTRGAPFFSEVTLYDHTGAAVDPAGIDLEAGPIEESDGNVACAHAILPVSWQIVPVQVERRTIGAVCVINDLRTLKAREADLRQARIDREVAQRTEQTRGAFMANMSHELRTPLNAILGYTEMVRDELVEQPVVPQAAADLDRVLTSARHLLSLINTLLDISKVDAGHLELVTETFALEAVLDEVQATVAPLMGQNGNTLVLHVVDVELHQDRLRLTQCLLNLVANAAKFTEAGTVQVRCAVEGPVLQIDVIDDGIGIDADALQQLFKPFVQAHRRTAHAYGGTGLGLVLTRHLVERMGGDVTVVSQVGSGSTFTLRVPLCAPVSG